MIRTINSTQTTFGESCIPSPRVSVTKSSHTPTQSGAVIPERSLFIEQGNYESPDLTLLE
jgi:hypothetical protein